MFLFRRKKRPLKTSMAPGAEREPGGRRYLEGVTYVLPKDIDEAHRLDFQHYLLHAVIGGHFVAPISEQVSTILDVATGTGRWAHEMARTFPNVQVIGLDMEAPKELYNPPVNYRFIQGNLFAGLPFTENIFDFVHQRFLVLALPAKQWPFVLSELVRVTKPGGYIELVEGGGNFLRIGSATAQLKQWWDVASKVHGIDVSLMEHLPDLLKGAWIQQIEHQTYRVPVGWGGRAGTMLQQDILASLPGIKSFICKNAAVSPSLFDQTIEALPAEWKRYRTCYEYYVAYGQKGGRG